MCEDADGYICNNDVYMMKSNVTGVYATTNGNKYFMYAEKTKTAK